MKPTPPTVTEAARALLLKMDEVHNSEEWKAVWLLVNIHGNGYDGPTYNKELMALRSALVLEAVFTPL